MTAMRTQPYYYTDSCFQVEMNLHQTRLDLIDMVEQDEDGCLVCNHLKCCCLPDSSGSYYSSTSDLGFETSTYYDFNNMINMAPPAYSLPLPLWDEQIVPSASENKDRKKKDVENWVKSVEPVPVTHKIDLQKNTKSDSFDDTSSKSLDVGNVYGAIGQPVPAKTVVEAFFRRFRHVQKLRSSQSPSKPTSRPMTPIDLTKNEYISHMNRSSTPLLQNNIPPSYANLTPCSLKKTLPQFINQTAPTPSILQTSTPLPHIIPSNFSRRSSLPSLRNTIPYQSPSTTPFANILPFSVNQSIIPPFNQPPLLLPLPGMQPSYVVNQTVIQTPPRHLPLNVLHNIFL